MNKDAPTRELNDCMEREAQLLERYADLEERLPGSYRRRDWAELEGFIGELDGAAREIGEAEDRREAAFRALQAALHLAPGDDFHRLVRSLPEGLPAEEADRLREGFRRLKAGVVRVRCASSRMSHYFRSVSESIDATLAELLPHRRGRIYSRGGRAKQAADGSLIVDRRL